MVGMCGGYVCVVQAAAVQKVEAAQARQSSLNDHLNNAVEDMARKVRAAGDKQEFVCVCGEC